MKSASVRAALRFTSFGSGKSHLPDDACKDAFRLFWWVPRNKGINLGDEISPLVLSHVSGRKVVRGSPKDCDGIAIGSVFNPAMADRRKRTGPLFVWGSGTGKPMPCAMRQMSVTISALRGPLTAGQIEGCPDVPFGDPGLFVREIWPGPPPPRGPSEPGSA